MVNLSANNIKGIHLSLEKSFPRMEKGIMAEKEPLLDSLVEKPDRHLFGQSSPYQNIFTKAAVLMEALTRWHIFVDGNKRTGLMTAFIYLYINKHYLVIPLDSVKFTITVAQCSGSSEEENNELINNIAKWLQEHTGKDRADFISKYWKYIVWPLIKLLVLDKIGFKKKVSRTVNEWFALDSHGDYKNEALETSAFLIELMRITFKEVIRAMREQKKA